MSSSSGLVSQPLTVTGAFNWIYLIDWIVIGVLTLFFLFYFNRLFSTVVVYFVRLYTWRKFGVYIDIEALQISPLAGRIFFKGIRYHGNNETIFVRSGQVTWRYWLPKTKTAQIFEDPSQPYPGDDSSSDTTSDAAETKKDNEHGDFGLENPLKCTTHITVSGVEAFIYNRSPAYDIILESVKKGDFQNKTCSQQAAAQKLSEKVGFHGMARRDGGTSSSEGTEPDKIQDQNLNLNPVPSVETVTSYNGRTTSPRPQIPMFLGLLPVSVTCTKAAAVLGNCNTKAIITAKIDSAFGEFDASSPGPLDIFKILMSFEVTHPYIQMKPNVDFKEAQLAEAVSLKRQDANSEIDPVKPHGKLKSTTSRLFSMPRFASQSSESVNVKREKSGTWGPSLPFVNSDSPGQEQWHGLARYLDDSQHDEHDEWGDIEYAKSSVIADIPKIGFQFYWDIGGLVPSGHCLETSHSGQLKCQINGSTPPEYGMKLIVHGGSVNYGPWADRHRVVFQQIFFPAPFADPVPFPHLMPGETRLCTWFTLDLEVRDDVVLRIPFREPSKDTKWKGKAASLRRQGVATTSQGKKGRSKKASARNRTRPHGMTGTESRPYAWFDIKIKAASHIHYEMDLYARSNGYRKNLGLHVSRLEMFSSLNHALLWRSAAVDLHADLADPLAWNGLRKWVFGISISRLDLFLLRDHTYLLVDLIEDWSRGPLPDFYTFVPYRYILNVHFQDFKLYLNVNDANIIDNSDDLDDNEFVILYGKSLDSNLTIPLDCFRPAGMTITFDVHSEKLGFELGMPSKNTLNELLADKNVAQLRSVDLTGSYSNCNEVRAGLTETLIMRIDGKGLDIYFFGFLARMLAKIKENYFGETVHFRTLEEYQALVRRNFAASDSDPPVIKGNDLDVILDITAEDINVLLPAGLYSAEEYIRMHIDTADIDLRVNNYYLELMVNSNPIELVFTRKTLPGRTIETSKFETSGTQIFIDGVRVFGHRLFGLGPSEPPYVSNWDVDAGSIHGEFVPGFVEKLLGAAQSFIIGIDDSENAVPVPHFLALHDSTFVRFACPEIKLSCRIDEMAFLVSTGSISGNFNDYAGRLFSQRLNMTVPDIVLACVDAKVPSRRSEENRTAETFFYVGTALSMTMVQRYVCFDENRQLQQEHIRTHDTQRGRRATFLIRDTLIEDTTRDETISIPLPTLPPPLLARDRATADDNHDFEYGHQKTTSAPAIPETAYAQRPTKRSRRDRTLSPVKHALTIPLSSPFMSPHFPLNTLEPNIADVPLLRPLAPLSEYGADMLNETMFDDSIDEDTVHSTFMINLQPGVTVYCRPQAIWCIASLVDRLQPKFPSQILDFLHFKTISEVLATYSRKKGHNTIADISIRVPQTHVRFINGFTVQSEIRSDRYDVIASDLRVSTRIKAVPRRQDEVDSNSVHATLVSLSFHATEGTENVKSENVAAEVMIDDILVWLNNGDRTTAHSSFRTAEVSMASKKVEYLAKLIHRTAMLADDFQSRFVTTQVDQRKRVQALMFKLSTIGTNMPDPEFLTRPSYIIRSSPDHIRNSDSWKILSRFQYIYRRLSEQDRASLVSGCYDPSSHMPVDAERRVLASLDAWRSWDAIRVKESFLIRIVYGSLGDVEKMHDRNKVPLSISLRASIIKAIVDPGEKETSFSMEEIAVSMSITPPPPPSAVQLFHEYTEELKTNVLQIKTSKISLQVNWSICDLIDQIATLFEEVSPQGHTLEDQSSIQASTNAPFQTFHVVFSSNFVHLRVVAINAKAELAVAGMKVSVTGSGWQPNDERTTVNALTTADVLSLVIDGHDRQLVRCKVVSPSIWIDYEIISDQASIKQFLKMAGDSKEVKLQLKDQIIGLIEVAHSLIKDEVAHLTAMANSHDRPNKPTMPRNTEHRNLDPIVLTLTFFLNIYSIDIALTSDITYTTTGRTIRLSVAPQSKEVCTYDVDFDLKAQTHRLLASSKELSSSSELQMPAINGHIKVAISPGLINASAMVSMERIALEGTAVYGIASTLASTTALEAFKAIAADGKAVKDQIDGIFPQTGGSTPSEFLSKTVTFDASGALAGFAISADAPALGDGGLTLNLLFDVRSLYVRASNREKDADTPLPFPEFRVAFQELALELRQAEGDALRLVGKLSMGALLTNQVHRNTGSKIHRHFQLHVTGPSVDIGPATAPVLVEVLAHLQSRMRGLDLSNDTHYLRRLRHLDKHIPKYVTSMPEPITEDQEESIFLTTFSFDLRQLRMSYILEDTFPKASPGQAHDLVLTLESIELLTQSQAEAKLNMRNLQLGLFPSTDSSTNRPRTSALLPEVMFNVKHRMLKKERRIAFQVTGKALDLRLDPRFMLPVNDLERSMSASGARLRESVKRLETAPSSGGVDMKKLLGRRKLALLTIEADFEGAIVQLQALAREDGRKSVGGLRLQGGRYGQFAAEDSTATASLRAPGIALKVQYIDPETKNPSLNVEFRVDGSNNTLNPSVVPLFLQVSDTIKQLVRDDHVEKMEPVQIDKSLLEKPAFDPEETLVKADPRVILGKTKLNIGIRICRQEFSLRCQPIAKIAATASIGDIYFTINNIESSDNNHFFAASARVKDLRASLQHTYSRTTTFSFAIDSIVLSLMNSKHLGGKSGVSAILKIYPTKTQLNAKQLQDVLLFREIWLPVEIRQASQTAAAEESNEPEDYLIHRYQQIAAATAFSWNASVTVEKLAFELDLGQSIGKPSFSISNLWVTSTKTSRSRQNLCVGVDDINISSTGRLSGFFDLSKVKVRTSIAWPDEQNTNKAPLIQGSIGFDRLCVKAAFDYQAFAVAHVTSFEFIMYNVRDPEGSSGDRLVAILDGDTVNVYCIASTAALGLSLYQAFERLVEEKKASYEQSLKDIEKFLRRKSTIPGPRAAQKVAAAIAKMDEDSARIPISLHTDVVVTLRSLDIGAFPTALLDHQILKGEAFDVQARFAVVLEDGKIHSGLGMTFGQLRVALASVTNPDMPKQLGEITVEEVTANARDAKGGVILRVPKVVAAMQTWQAPHSNDIDYIFRSSFEGKIDVGWNYSRISSIKSMYATHSRTLATRLGKPLPQSAVSIKTSTAPPNGEDGAEPDEKTQKITAEVKLPQSSKYNYRALETPIIDTPQLRDMGEATPPLEWVGLNRDRLPNVTHQIMIVTLLEIAKEVEDAYSRILGSA